MAPVAGYQENDQGIQESQDEQLRGPRHMRGRQQVDDAIRKNDRSVSGRIAAADQRKIARKKAASAFAANIQRKDATIAPEIRKPGDARLNRVPSLSGTAGGGEWSQRPLKRDP